MKFRFCGDSDCPDWVLVEMNTLSRLSSVKLKLLAQVVAQGIITPPIDIQKAENLFADSKLDNDIELQACIACISFILSVATRFSSDSNVLHSELQQLGLPREHSTSLKRVFDEQISNLTEKFKLESLKINNLEAFSFKVDPETKCVVAELSIEGKPSKVLLTHSNVDVLLEDLINVRKTMHELAECSTQKI